MGGAAPVAHRGPDRDAVSTVGTVRRAPGPTFRPHHAASRPRIGRPHLPLTHAPRVTFEIEGRESLLALLRAARGARWRVCVGVTAGVIAGCRDGAAPDRTTARPDVAAGPWAAVGAAARGVGQS